jgi:hypothetical protein
MQDDFTDEAGWSEVLMELKAEHRDLDTAIEQLATNPVGDQLLLRRLKKRKLSLKDRITSIERLLEPPEPA